MSRRKKLPPESAGQPAKGQALGQFMAWLEFLSKNLPPLFPPEQDSTKEKCHG